MKTFPSHLLITCCVGLGFGIACGEAGGGGDAGTDGGDAGPGCSTYDMCLRYVVLCGGGDNDVENCQQGFEGLDCTMPGGLCECLVGSETCDEALACMVDLYEQYWVGGDVSADCVEFCEMCESCHEDFPEMVEHDCGDYSPDADGECVTGCEGDDQLQGRLSALVVEISEFGCCQLDYFF